MKVKQVFNEQLGIHISELGFGAMRLPTLNNGKIDRVQAGALIDHAYEGGVNFYDTAHPYHGGESQVFLGETLKKYPRDSYLFANKLPTWAIKSKQDVKNIFEEQLKNCGVSFFDFFMIHGLGEDRYDLVDKHSIYEQLLAEKNAGRIRFLGFSYHGNYETFERLLDNYKWDFVLIPYNYVDDVLLGSGKFYQLMTERGIPGIAMQPVRGRYLATPPQKALDELNNEYTPAGWALRWCRHQPNIAVTLSGMSTMAQVEENIRIFAQATPVLTADEIAAMERARDVMLAIKTVPCPYCRYCMDCPEGVDIPKIMEVYNQYKLFPNEFRAGVFYGKLVRDGKGYDRCTQCGICAPQCPQKIDIPAALSKVHDELEPLRQRFIASV